MTHNLAMDRTPLSRTMVYIAVVLAYLIGGGSLLLLIPFLFGTSFSVIELELDLGGALAWNGVLCFAFFVQHSGMIRRSYRRRMGSVVGTHYHPALYSIASGIFLLTLVMLWQPSTLVLVKLEGPARWLARAFFFAAFAGFWWGARSLGTFDALGGRTLLARLRGKPPRTMGLAIRGPYRWVRHPLYTFVLLLLWSCPDLSMDRLLLNTTWTTWIVLGTWLEERDLTADFGDDYRAYQRSVPMLIPWRGPATPQA